MSAPEPLSRVAPASVGQASLWFLRQVMPCKTAYNVAVQFRLSGELDARALEASVREIVHRHESLRTTFTAPEGTVLQVIHEDMTADVATIDLATHRGPEAEASRLARLMAAQPFDLDNGPLIGVRIFRLGPCDHTLCVVMDHIVADGTSLGILWRELEALYGARRAGEPSSLPPPARQYAECVEAQNQWLGTRTFARHLEYWREHLAGATACDFPTDRLQPPIRSYRGDLAIGNIPKAIVAPLRAACARYDVGLFAALLAALDVVLARCSGQRDVVVMVPMAGRQRFAAAAVVGYFANVLLLRTEVPDGIAFGELAQRVNNEIMAGVFRQDVPFAKAIEELRPDRSLGDDSLARISLSFFARPGSMLNLPGVEATFGELPNGGAKFDLSLLISEHAEDLTISAEYNSDVFDADTVQGLLEHYKVLLEAASISPACAVAELPLLAPNERHRLLVEWNSTEAQYPRDATVASLVSDQARAQADAVAARFEGKTLSYGELERRSNQVARSLLARGVGPGVLVGIAVERSLEMVVGLLGILKAGGTYVPLDPAYPRERLALMAEDSGLRVLVTQASLMGVVKAASALRLDADAGEIGAQSDTALETRVEPESLAYVIYTSGSTGKPKGVQIPHRAVVNFLTSMARHPGLSREDRLLAVTSLSFDIAGLELWLPLTVGAQVVIASRETASNGVALTSLLESEQITVLQATPSTYRLLLESGWKGTRGLVALIGGEATPRELAEQLLERVSSLWNMYGPTETTIWSCVQELRKGEPVLIGHPIANTQVYVLDRNLQAVPAGVTGEIYIGGEGLAVGYLGRPELTAERFVGDPFAGRDGARMYRTGDLGRFRRDGALEYQGRNDFQVKLRGYRIELGEIEATLASHPSVREAVVVAYEEGPGDQRLAAYVTSDTSPDFDVLRAHLRAKLPEYMVPSTFTMLERLPLTANNKIDRKALPRPERAAIAGSRARAMPQEAVEFTLRSIWEELLHEKGIGVDDSFFDVGGHSLLALKLFERIKRAFGISLPIAALFQAPTIRKIADLLRGEGWQPSWASLVPIQTSGSNPPLFCVHAVGGNVLNYRLLSRYLGDDQPFYGLQARGLGGTEPAHDRVEDMAAAYLREMKTVQPEGPYYLCGASSGGAVAFEMAQQLHARHEPVGLLSLLDTHVPQPPPRRREAVSLSVLHRRGTLLDLHLGELLLRTPRAGLGYLVERARDRLDGIGQPMERTMRGATPIAQQVYAANKRAIQSYTPGVYPGGAVMLLSRDMPQRTAFDERVAWADYLRGGLSIRFIPGDHEHVLDEPVVQSVAAALSQCLREAYEQRSHRSGGASGTAARPDPHAG